MRAKRSSRFGAFPSSNNSGGGGCGFSEKPEERTSSLGRASREWLFKLASFVSTVDGAGFGGYDSGVG
jgi:hypothetical protein